MKLQFKNNFLGYFQFYYSVLGKRVFINFALCIFVSFFDGIGLAMFMPLLQAVSGSEAMGNKSMGELHHITDAIQAMGFGLTIGTVLMTLVIVFVAKGALRYVQTRYQVYIRHLFMKRVRYKLVTDLRNLSYEGFLKMDAGRIQNTLIMEVQRLFQTMNFYFNAGQAAVMLVTYIIFAFLANYQFAIMVAVGAGLTNFIYRKIYVATKKISKDLSKKGHDFNGQLIQAIHNFKYLKATNYFAKFEKRLKSVIDHTEMLNKKMGAYNSITSSMKEPMIMCVVALVIYSQITWLGASLTSILFSLMLFYRALSFLVSVQNHWQNFIQNIGAMHSITEFSNELDVMSEHYNAKEFAGVVNNITLKDVSFYYGDRAVLNQINLVIPKNQTIAFIGESGSGKTTLANLISSLIQPKKGDMLVDGVSLKEYGLNTYRAKVGYISQEPVVFNDNIFNNITFWAEPTEANIKHFWKVVELAALTDFIHNQPEKERTNLGDNGILISGGQKQRISIARELYKEAEILILDEATSALDSETEKMIKENIDALHGSYTIIVIAHRLSTIRNVDTIFLLERGKVTASGGFNEMLETSDRFRKMVSLQEF